MSYLQGDELASELVGLRLKPRGLPPNAMLEQIEPTFQRLFYPMGQLLLFQTNSPVLLQAASEAFGSFPRFSGEQASSPLVLRLFAHEVELAPGHREDDEHPRPLYRTQGHLFYVTVGASSTAVADLLRGYAFGFVAPAVVQDRTLVRYVFLEGLAFAMLGTARQFIPVHAACVVKGGTSLVLQGSSGRGKSTLAYACVRRGYQMLAEDGLLVECLSDGARIWGWPWKLHLLPDSKRFFSELEHEQPQLQINGEWKLEIESELFFPGSTTTNAAPGLVIFLERGAAPGRACVEPLPIGEAVERFEVVWPWQVGWPEEKEQRVFRLLERGTYRLRMEGSPDDAVDALDAVLASLEQRAP